MANSIITSLVDLNNNSPVVINSMALLNWVKKYYDVICSTLTNFVIYMMQEGKWILVLYILLNIIVSEIGIFSSYLVKKVEIGSIDTIVSGNSFSLHYCI